MREEEELPQFIQIAHPELPASAAGVSGRAERSERPFSPSRDASSAVGYVFGNNLTFFQPIKFERSEQKLLCKITELRMYVEQIEAYLLMKCFTFVAN